VNHRDKQDQDRARMDIAVAMTAGALDTNANDVLGTGRSTRTTLARQVAMYVASTGFGMSFSRVAAAIGRDRSTVAHACKLVEERREAPEFDRWLDALEQSVASVPPVA
jgi:chromosomal replication initiation ATPase DnaA